MDFSTILLCLLSSALAAAIVTSIKDIVLWVASKKTGDKTKQEIKNDKLAKLEVNQQNTEEKLKKLLEETHTYMESNKRLSEAIISSNKLILNDRIRFIAMGYIRKNKISFEDRKLIHSLWDTYHKEWGGNGDLNLIMNQIDELDLEV